MDEPPADRSGADTGPADEPSAARAPVDEPAAAQAPVDEPAAGQAAWLDKSDTAGSWAEEWTSREPGLEQPLTPLRPGAETVQSADPWKPAERLTPESAVTQSFPDSRPQLSPEPLHEPLSAPQYPPVQYPPTQYAPAQYAPAQYPPAQYPPAEGLPAERPPAEQYPQYAPPGGFGSPQGPAPMEESGTAEAYHQSAAAPAPASSWYRDVGSSTEPAESAGQPASPGWAPPPEVAPSRRRRSRRGRGAFVALIVAISLFSGLIGGVAGVALWNGVADSSSGRNPTFSLPPVASAGGKSAASGVTTVASEVLPSVVSIKVKTATEAGTGSGFVIDASKGYILTNNHVVTAGGTTPATSIVVVFQDGTQVSAKIVGRDASYDLAVVKVRVRGLRQLQLGNSDQVRVGDPVVAIGAPLGLQGTVTTGIVSALNRPVAAGEGDKPAFINAIQTDAAINPGNSGGPLVDSTGKVIAVNSAIARSPDSTGESSGNIGLGFAIPSNQARRTAQELVRTGKAEHPIIGVSLDSSYEGEGVKVSDQPTSTGVAPVTPNGPAALAGIRPGDIITKINGRPVTEPDELIVAIRAETPGTTVTLTIRRGSSQKQVHVRLSASND